MAARTAEAADEKETLILLLRPILRLPFSEFLKRWKREDQQQYQRRKAKIRRPDVIGLEFESKGAIQVLLYNSAANRVSGGSRLVRHHHDRRAQIRFRESRPATLADGTKDHVPVFRFLKMAVGLVSRCFGCCLILVKRGRYRW